MHVQEIVCLVINGGNYLVCRIFMLCYKIFIEALLNFQINFFSVFVLKAGCRIPIFIAKLVSYGLRSGKNGEIWDMTSRIHLT